MRLFSAPCAYIIFTLSFIFEAGIGSAKAQTQKISQTIPKDSLYSKHFGVNQSLPNNSSSENTFSNSPSRLIGKDKLKLSPYKSKIKSGFAFHIGGSIETRSSNWKDTLTNMPLNYSRILLSPSISILNVPLTSNIYYSTEQGAVNQNLKNINVQLDYRKLNSDIYKRLILEKQDIQMGIGSNVNRNGQIDLDYKKYEDITPDLNNGILLQKTKQRINPDLNPKIKLLGNLETLEKMDTTRWRRFEDSINIYHPSDTQKVKNIKRLNKFLHLTDKEFEQIEDSLKYSPDYKLITDLRTIQKLQHFQKGDLKTNASGLEKAGLISKYEKFALGIKKLSIGDNYPSYTPFTINGMKIRGADIAYQFKNIYIASAAGTTPEVHSINRFTIAQTNKQVIALAAGLGEKTGTHFHVNYVQTSQNEQIIDKYFFPMEGKLSKVLSGDFAYSFKRKLTLGGELANSNIADNSFLQEIQPVRNTTSLSKNMNMAYNAFIKYNEQHTGTTFSIESKRLEPNFISYAVPFLRTDIFQTQVKVGKEFFKNKVLADIYWVHESDNLNNLKTATSIVNAPGGDLMVNFPGLPYLTVSYMPTSMSSQSILDSFHYQSSFKTLMVQSGFQKYISGATSLSAISLFWQKENNSMESNPSYNKVLNFSESIQFKFPISVYGEFSFISSSINNQSILSRNYSLLINYAFTKKATFACGISKDQYLQSTKIMLLSKVSYDLRKNNKIVITLDGIGTNNNKMNETKHTYYDLVLRYLFFW